MKRLLTFIYGLILLMQSFGCAYCITISSGWIVYAYIFGVFMFIILATLKFEKATK